MSELTLLILRVGFLVLIWLFVFSVIYALRSDLFGAPAKKIKKQQEDFYTAPQPVNQGVGQAASATPANPHTSQGPPSKLVVLTGIASGSTIPLDDDSITIGRSPDSTLVIVDEYTSTYHAKLFKEGGAWVIQDLDSTNGTKVEGKKITAKTPLPAYKQVVIGTTSFELRP